MGNFFLCAENISRFHVAQNTYIRVPQKEGERSRARWLLSFGNEKAGGSGKFFSQTGGNGATVEFYFSSTAVVAAREVFREKKTGVCLFNGLMVEVAAANKCMRRCRPEKRKSERFLPPRAHSSRWQFCASEHYSLSVRSLMTCLEPFFIFAILFKVKSKVLSTLLKSQRDSNTCSAGQTFSFSLLTKFSSIFCHQRMNVQ
jgi:hypothetical protein